MHFASLAWPRFMGSTPSVFGALPQAPPPGPLHAKPPVLAAHKSVVSLEGQDELRALAARAARCYGPPPQTKSQPTPMKTILTLLAVVLTLSLATSTAEAKEKKKDLRHVVVFKFKGTVTEAQITKVVEDFRALEDKIPQIKKLEDGTNNSPEKLNKGFTHAFILSFKSEKDRDDYIVHPDHKKFGASLGDLLEDVFVIDFWGK
jgi:hypothetical protein